MTLGSPPPAPLRAGSARPPAEIYDVALTDLDGVIYRGAKAVRGAADAICQAKSGGMRFAFVTNNALRTPDIVSGHLTDLGVPATPDDVVTSAQAAARLLRDQLQPGDPVLVSGGEGLRTAVVAAGLVVVSSAGEQPKAVVCGFDPTLDYARLAEAALAVRAGAVFVASNLDATVPTERGLLPGNGALVSVICTATGRRPVEAGKPERALHEESIRRSGAQRPLIVGDRLDTDIEAGVRWGTPSLLVFTGVTDPADLLTADEVHRPSLLSKDLTGLLVVHPPVTPDKAGWRCGRWRAVAERGVLHLTAAQPGESQQAAGEDGAAVQHGAGDDAAADLGYRAPKDAGSPARLVDRLTDDGLDALRVAAVAAWQSADDGSPVHEVVGAPRGSGLTSGPLRR